MMVNDHLDFDELSVAESSYDDLPNNHQLSSLNIDDRESLPSEHDDDYDGINIGNNSPLHINNNNNNNNNNSNHQGAAESSTQQQDTNNKKTNLPLLSACYTAALTTGATTYAFSFYSNALKSSLHLSQNQLDTLSSAIFCAGILSWIPGMVVDSFGARFAMTVGGIGNMINLSCYWMIVTERWKIWNINVLIFVLSALGVFIFVGCALVTGSVFKVIVESCGKGTKGKAVGCAKGYVGVGSGVYVCLFSALFGSQVVVERLVVEYLSDVPWSRGVYLRLLLRVVERVRKGRLLAVRKDMLVLEVECMCVFLVHCLGVQVVVERLVVDLLLPR